MAVLNNTGIRAGASSASVDSDPYLIKQSLRFNAADTAYLSKTFSSAGDLKKWTFNCWWKNKADATSQAFFGCRPSVTNDTTFCVRIETDGTIKVGTENEGIRTTTQTFRDPGAWMMLTVIMDTANGTPDDRCQIWVNGERITAFSSNATITQNREFGWNKAAEMNIGRMSSLGYYSSLMLADVYFIDGQALEPSAFGELDVNKMWQPKEPVFPSNPSGNSFNFRFEDTANIGEDSLLSKLATATGGKPIYQTTDTHGNVKGSGYATDSSAGSTDGSGLVLALPGDVLTDEHDEIVSASTAHNVVGYNSIAVTTSESKFYGSSIEFGSGKYLKPDSHTDFAFGTGDFTFEWWMKVSSLVNGSEASPVEFTSGSCNINIQHSNRRLYYFNGSSVAANDYMFDYDQWTHIAVVRDNGTIRFFKNGVAWGTGSCSVDYGTSARQLTMFHGSPNNQINGFVNDFRIYKGVAKYTSAFVAPAGNTWIGTNLTATTGNELVTKEIVNNSSDWTNLTTQDVDFGTIGHLQSIAMNRHDQGLIHAVKVNNSRLEDNGTTYSAANRFTFNSGSSWYLTHTADKMFDDDDSTYASASNGNQANAGFTWSAVSPSDLNIKNVNLKVRSWGDGTGAKLIVKHNLYKTQDILTDSPSNYLPDGADDAEGGATRGNYCTWNPLAISGPTFTNGNLDVSSATSSTVPTSGTFGMSSGKWYWEVIYTGGNDGIVVGITKNPMNGTMLGENDDSWSYHSYSGKKNHNSNQVSYGTAFTPTAGSGHDTTVGIALDVDNRKIWWRIDGTWQASGNPADGTNAAFTDLDENVTYFPSCGPDSGGVNHCEYRLNAGQRKFEDNAPTGFKSLCSTNLPDPSIAEPGKHFDVLTYTGEGGTKTLTGLGFQPDMVWTKCRDEDISHIIYDAVRTAGAAKGLNVDLTRAEGSSYDESSGTTFGYLSAFTSDGYTVVDGNQSTGYVNKDEDTYVSWNWDAGASVTPSSSYNITPSAQWVNSTAGFSITAYTGNNSTDQTIPHGLATAPDFIITKSRSYDINWPAYHSSCTANKGLFLDLDNRENTWVGGADNVDHGGIQSVNNNTWKTAVGASTDNNVNKDGETYISYAWTAIPGYSAFGLYTGNNNAFGPFVYTGFLPRWLLVKRIADSKGWMLIDTTRNPYNVVQGTLYPADNFDEHTGTGHRIDLNSNGFKIRDANDRHNSVEAYVYCAFAESPFKFSRAR